MMRSTLALLATLRAAEAQDLFIPARQLRGSANASGDTAVETIAKSILSLNTTVPWSAEEASSLRDGMPADTFADASTGMDIPGPYTEEPSEDEAAAPRPAKENWENATLLHGASFNAWGQSFCEVHHTGFFCDGTTRVRCCRKEWGFVKCGTTWHSNSCGWNEVSPLVTSNGGWIQSAFCQSHHVGWFCYAHHTVHCCNDFGHFVQCTTWNQAQQRC